MPDGYDSHADYMNWVLQDATERQEVMHAALRSAFSTFIELREVEVINFSIMTAQDLAKSFLSAPEVLKPILAACNIAARAIERDLEIRNLDTYRPRLSSDIAHLIAGYVKPFLPQELAIPTLGELDRHFFVDKQIRMMKGQWEQCICEALSAFAKSPFKKRKFQFGQETFEIDAASPPTGQIEVAIDIKRIEARRDIHKRCDEIANKAMKFKKVFPLSKFAAVVYYPFTAEHINVQNRLVSDSVDAVAFASQSTEQIGIAIGLLVDQLGIRKQ